MAHSSFYLSIGATMQAQLSLLPDATHLAIERAATTLAQARAVLALKRQIAERAREFYWGAENRADRLQTKMIEMRFPSPPTPPAPAPRLAGAVAWRRPD
jgi:hypothetical protein